MELEKVTSKGRVIMMNSSIDSLRKAQAAFAGEAERLGLKDKEDVAALVAELRRERMET